MNKTARPIEKFFQDSLPDICVSARSAPGGIVAPDPRVFEVPIPAQHMNIIIGCVRALGIKRAFEFGSGFSTICLLKEGLEVTSLEDSKDWLEHTRRQVPAELLAKHHGFHRPLQTVFDGMVPFRGWHLDGELTDALCSAELILIDGPFPPPMREHVLLNSLRLTQNVLIIVDDFDHQNARRFCTSIARTNAHVLFHNNERLAFLSRTSDCPVYASRGPLEYLKAWRRYFITF